MNTYTKEQFLLAAKKGEVSMIDAEHVVSLLDEVVIENKTYSELTNTPVSEIKQLPIDTRVRFLIRLYEERIIKLTLKLDDAVSSRNYQEAAKVNQQLSTTNLFLHHLQVSLDD